MSFWLLGCANIAVYEHKHQAYDRKTEFVFVKSHEFLYSRSASGYFS